jgi:hypothetical protein
VRHRENIDPFKQRIAGPASEPEASRMSALEKKHRHAYFQVSAVIHRFLHVRAVEPAPPAFVDTQATWRSP